jgi:signal transduction histidine kinase
LAERTRQLERERGATARLAVIDERVRIARELHDVVAHHVSLIGIQAGAARLVLDRRPEKAGETLAAIEASSREAVREMQRLLGFLRQDRDDDPLAPQPGMGQIETLVAQMRTAGLGVTLEIGGTVRPLPPSVDLSAYRIVQEALTNALKHAGPTAATVGIRYGDRALELEIADDGGAAPPAAAVDGGNGLIGMRERVGLLGGELHVGQRPQGGFAVRARLPLDGRQR